MGTASMEKRVLSLGMGMIRRAKMMDIAVRSAQKVSCFVTFLLFLDIKKSSFVLEEIKYDPMLCP
jgi:hypothetical protein